MLLVFHLSTLQKGGGLSLRLQFVLLTTRWHYINHHTRTKNRRRRISGTRNVIWYIDSTIWPFQIHYYMLSSRAGEQLWSGRGALPGRSFRRSARGPCAVCSARTDWWDPNTALLPICWDIYAPNILQNFTRLRIAFKRAVRATSFRMWWRMTSSPVPV